MKKLVLLCSIIALVALGVQVETKAARWRESLKKPQDRAGYITSYGEMHVYEIGGKVVIEWK